MVVISTTNIIAAGTVCNSEHFLFSFSNPEKKNKRKCSLQSWTVRKFALAAPMIGKEKRFLLFSDNQKL